jgi:3-hydroxyacyl-[acyl-carrier-protein] dehydratase
MRIEYFQLIDRVVALRTAERKITAEATVPANSTIFEGHFPGYPLMPGVLLVEAMAQTSGWLIIALTRFARMPFLAQIKSAKLRTFVLPGQGLAIEAELLHEGSGFAVTRATIKRDATRICDAELTFRVLDFPNAEMAATMREAATRVGLPMEPVDG